MQRFRKSFIVFALIANWLATAPVFAELPNLTDVALTDATDSISYVLGLSIGQDLRTSSFQEINPDVLIQSIMMGINNARKEGFTDEKTKVFMQEYIQSQNHKKDIETLERGRAFLAWNKTQRGVITRPSGLQYKILKDSNGPRPSATDMVTIRFYGALIDSTMFQSTPADHPLQVYVEDVISGLSEALQLMRVGATWMVYIPPELAYGNEPPSGLIPPNSTLVCRVDLLSVDYVED